MTKKISAFAILIFLLPGLAQSESSLPADHFTGLTLDTPLQTNFTTGKAIRFSGILSDNSLSGILFRLTPADGGDPIQWLFDVSDGRFDGYLLLNHRQAGEYNLDLFAYNKEDESWPWLGSFSPMKILQGQGEILLPVDFFTGVLLDEPLSTEFGTSTASSFSGEVLDPALANGHISFDFLHLDSGEEIRLFIDLEGLRFRRGLLFDQGRPGAGDYELSVFIGQQGWLNVSFVGRFVVELVDDGAPSAVPVDFFTGVLLYEPLPIERPADRDFTFQGSVTDSKDVSKLAINLISTEGERWLTVPVDDGRFSLSFPLAFGELGPIEFQLFQKIGDGEWRPRGSFKFIAVEPAVATELGGVSQEDRCPFINTAADCETEALAKGLRIGSEEYDFEGDYGTKGCYAHDSGTYEGIAFFGTGGDTVDMEADAQTANGQYRVTGPCSEIVEGTENIDLSDCSYSLPSCKEVDFSEPSQVGLNPKNLAELSEWFLEKKDLPIFSLLIARENKLVYELYSGDIKPEMSHYLFSTTKSVTSALVGAAIAEGKISGVDVPISQIIPSKLFSSPEQQNRWDAVTLKNALGMSAHSVATPPHDNSPEANARQERLNVHNRLTMVLGQDIMENPGEKFLYNDLTPYLVSGALAYNVGTDLLTFGGQTIFGKLGFHNEDWLHQDPSGLDIGGYGLKLRPVDMLKFGLTYLNEGVYKGKRILPKEWVDLAYKPYMPPDVEYLNYGYYWWKGWYQHNGVVYETIEANGWRGQHIVIMPKLKLVLVATHYLNDEDDKKDLKRLYLEKYILPAILDKPRLTAEDKEWSSKILTYNSQIQKGPSRFPENGEERVRPGLSNKNKRIRFNQTATAVVETRTTPVPQAFALMQNYPNPFNGSTFIHFSLPTSDIVDLSIFNIAGQKVATLAQGMRQAGTHVINWNGKDDNEQALASGLYFYRLQSKTHEQTRKLLLLR